METATLMCLYIWSELISLVQDAGSFAIANHPADSGGRADMPHGGDQGLRTILIIIIVKIVALSILLRAYFNIMTLFTFEHCFGFLSLEGCSDTRPGLPILYSATPEFLQHFGLNSILEMPPLVKPEEEGEGHDEMLKG